MKRLGNQTRYRGERSFRDDFKVLVCESGREMATLTQTGKLGENTLGKTTNLIGIFFFVVAFDYNLCMG